MSTWRGRFDGLVSVALVVMIITVLFGIAECNQKNTELEQKNTELKQKDIELEQNKTELIQKDEQHQDDLALLKQEFDLDKRNFYLQNATDSIDRLQQRIQGIRAVLDVRGNEGLDVAERQGDLEDSAECYRASIDGMERIRYEEYDNLDFANLSFAQIWKELGENIKCGHSSANEACPSTDSMCRDLSAPDLSPLPAIDLLLREGGNVLINPLR